MSNEDMSDLSSSSCSNRSKELKALLSEGGRGGRVEKKVHDDRDFINKIAIDEFENADEKSESETFNVDDDIIINVNKPVQKMRWRRRSSEEELLPKSLKHKLTSESMRHKWIKQNRITYSIHYMLFQGYQTAKDPFSNPVKLCVECNGIATKSISICGNG